MNNACVGETVAPFWCGGMERVGVRGTSLIMLAFVIKIIICTDLEDIL